MALFLFSFLLYLVSRRSGKIQNWTVTMFLTSVPKLEIKKKKLRNDRKVNARVTVLPEVEYKVNSALWSGLMQQPL